MVDIGPRFGAEACSLSSTRSSSSHRAAGTAMSWLDFADGSETDWLWCPDIPLLAPNRSGGGRPRPQQVEVDVGLAARS